MKPSHIIALLIYVVIAVLYLGFSTKFKKGWTQKSIMVKGGRLNVLLFIFLFFVVLLVVVRTTM